MEFSVLLGDTVVTEVLDCIAVVEALERTGGLDEGWVELGEEGCGRRVAVYDINRVANLSKATVSSLSMCSIME